MGISISHFGMYLNNFHRPKSRETIHTGNVKLQQ